MVKRGISFRRFILSDFGRVSGFVRGAVRRALAAFISRAARRGAGRCGRVTSIEERTRRSTCETNGAFRSQNETGTSSPADADVTTCRPVTER